jgi:4-hydroxybenzoyl-CoA thioesterase
MSKPIEPFVHSMRVGWADCDPAWIAYTGRIPYWALEAIDAWWADRFGKDVYALNRDRNFGTPFVHLSFDFRSPVTPRHRLDCTVRLVRFGETSVRFRVDGRQDGTLCFEGRFVMVLVDAAKFTSAPPPADIRDRLRALLEPED